MPHRIKSAAQKWITVDLNAKPGGEMAKKIVVLGSTGSIGVQTLEVAKNTGIEVLGLTANKNIDVLEKQVNSFHPRRVAVFDELMAEQLKRRVKNVDVLAGRDGVLEIARLNGADTVVNAIVGSAGLLPTLEAVNAGKDVALANKETLVCAGEIVMRRVREKGVSLIPIDSEHSAVFQCMQGNSSNKIRKILLTASGGPFRTKTADELRRTTSADALEHPTWSMGAKITIDSATLMNKGLEVIEAHWLFGVPAEKIQVLVHPQSIIHSMVEFEDGAVLAQLGEPDMRVPIQYALHYPDRPKNDFPKLDLLAKNTLTFEEPRTDCFRCFPLALEALKQGGVVPAVMNAANEAAVSRFLLGEISFFQIPELIEAAMSAYNVKNQAMLDIKAVMRADAWAREFVFGKNISGGKQAAALKSL